MVEESFLIGWGFRRDKDYFLGTKLRINRSINSIKTSIQIGGFYIHSHRGKLDSIH